MTGLVIKLAPKERILINGAVIENGDRRGRLTILTSGANILRLKDAIHPRDATTPVKRVCYSAQLILTGDCDPAQAKPGLLKSIEELSQVFTDSDSRSLLTNATKALLHGEYYKFLKVLRTLLPREERVLNSRMG